MGHFSLSNLCNQSSTQTCSHTKGKIGVIFVTSSVIDINHQRAQRPKQRGWLVICALIIFTVSIRSKTVPWNSTPDLVDFHVNIIINSELIYHFSISYINIISEQNSPLSFMHICKYKPY